MFNIEKYIPSPPRSRKMPNGWIAFNCPVCYLHNQTNDKRMRGGLKIDSSGWAYHCFNCNHRARYEVGKTVSDSTKQLLRGLGVEQEIISRMGLDSLRHRIDNSVTHNLLQNKKIPTFRDHPIKGTIIQESNPLHREHVNYLRSRCLTTDSYPFLLEEGKRKGITIPFTYKDRIVGQTTRFLDERKPKYLNITQPGYVFGIDFQQDDWQWGIVVEGPFCAISLGAMAVMHQTISDEQALLLQNLRREIVVVPDMDRSGLGIISRAVELGYSVSFPPWWDKAKDVNEAVTKWGRLPVLISILNSKENNPIKIEIRRKMIAKRIRS
jgi:hypothetical protein